MNVIKKIFVVGSKHFGIQVSLNSTKVAVLSQISTLVPCSFLNLPLSCAPTRWGYKWPWDGGWQPFAIYPRCLREDKEASKTREELRCRFSRCLLTFAPEKITSDTQGSRNNESNEIYCDQPLKARLSFQPETTGTRSCHGTTHVWKLMKRGFSLQKRDEQRSISKVFVVVGSAEKE